MADSSLDDFFAKKDKSKKKSKSTKLTPDDILSKSEEPVKKEKKHKKEKTKSQSSKTANDGNIIAVINLNEVLAASYFICLAYIPFAQGLCAAAESVVAQWLGTCLWCKRSRLISTRGKENFGVRVFTRSGLITGSSRIGPDRAPKLAYSFA